jgi:UDP-N-acetyl-D-glucosamine dehydrogenase
MLVVLESTTYPGTTEELVLPHLAGGTEAAERSVGRDFFLAFSPERIDPGRLDWNVQTTPKVIGGVTPACLQVATSLYRCAIDTVVPVSTTRVAETVKLLENTFRAVNIGLANEMAIMCDRLGIDVWEVMDAAKTKPFGFMPFYPGPGLGGHCIPIDPQYLSWKLRTLNYHARFIQLAEEVNTAMPDHVVGKVADALNDDGKSVRGARIVILGMAYKANVADARESPSLEIAAKLIAKGARLSYHDPHVPYVMVAGSRLESVALDAELLRRSDSVVVVTAHESFDWPWVLEHSRLVVDTRNATRDVGARAARVVKL